MAFAFIFSNFNALHIHSTPPFPFCSVFLNVKNKTKQKQNRILLWLEHLPPTLCTVQVNLTKENNIVMLNVHEHLLHTQNQLLNSVERQTNKWSSQFSFTIWEMDYFARTAGLFTETLRTNITFSFLLDWITLQRSALCSILYMEWTGRVWSILFVLFLVWLDFELSHWWLPPGFGLYGNLCRLALWTKLYGANAWTFCCSLSNSLCKSGYAIVLAI